MKAGFSCFMVGAGLLLFACGDESSPRPRPGNPPRIVAILLKPSSLELQVGESKAFEVSLQGEGKFDESLVWTSSDPEVVLVEDGVVTALALGTAIVTATSAADEEVSTKATVSVVPPPIPKGRGGLDLRVEGLPEGLDAGLELRGPESFSRKVEGDTLILDLLPGAYQIHGAEIREGEHAYVPVQTPVAVEVKEQRIANATFAFALEQKIPFTISASGVLLPQAGEAVLEVSIFRDEGFEEAVSLHVEGLPLGVTADPESITEEGETVQFRLVADGSNLRLTDYTFHLVGEQGGAQLRLPVTLRLGAVVSNFESGGPGSLRYFLERAGDFTLPGEKLTITFQEPTSYTVIFLEETLVIRQDLAIRGPVDEDGQPLIELNGREAIRILEVGTLDEAPPEVEIADLVFRHGKAPEGPCDLCSPGAGGAILNRGSLFLERVHLEDNEASMGGGAISSGESLRMRGGRLGNNRTSSLLGASGGGILHGSLPGGTPLLLEDLAIYGNRSSEGGGVYSSAAVHLIRCAVFDNLADHGGGVRAEEVSMLNSTIANNAAERSGGGVQGREVEVRFSTISGNSAGESAGGINGATSFVGSILFGNTSPSNPDMKGRATSLGHNLFGNMGETNVQLLPSDGLGVDPQLLPLDDNGGPTPTMAVTEESPAVDGIPWEECLDLDASPIDVDQRGESRQVGAACDVGAFELQL